MSNQDIAPVYYAGGSAQIEANTALDNNDMSYFLRHPIIFTKFNTLSALGLGAWQFLITMIYGNGNHAQQIALGSNGKLTRRAEYNGSWTDWDFGRIASLTAESNIAFRYANVHKNNDMVLLQLTLLQVPNSTNNIHIATLPEGYRPVRYITVPVIGVPSGSTDVYLLRTDIGVDGKIYIYNYSGHMAQEVYIHVTFMAS